MNFMELAAKLSLDSSDYERGLGKAKSLASSISNGIGKAFKIGAAAVTAATTAVVAFGGAAVKTGMSFDKSMSQVAATMGLTMDEMENQVGSVETSFGHFEGTLRDFAQYMGSNTAFSATQAADALNYMALAGYDAQTSMNMLPNVLNLAAAGSMDLARASDMVTDTQTAFGITLERTSQMVDEMAKAASTGNTSVEQLGDAFLTVGGLTQELNGGFVSMADGTKVAVDGVQELEIMLTAMANAGIKGSEAGTHVRNMLMKLSAPTSEGTKQLEALGVAVFDAEGNMRSMKDIMGDLNGALGGLTQEEKLNAIKDLFNARDIASAEALLNAVGEDWDDIGASILDAEGAAAQMAETQLDNLAGDVTLFKSAWEGLQIAISDGVSPALREFVQFGTKSISRLTEAFKTRGIKGAMGELGSILSEGTTMIVEKVPEFLEAGSELLSALGQGIMDNLPMLADTAVEVIFMLATYLIEALPEIAQAGMDLLVKLGEGIVENLPMLVDSAVEVIKELAAILSDPVQLEKLVEAAVEILLALADGLIESLPTIIEAVVSIITTIATKLTEPDNIVRLVEAAFQIMMAVQQGIWNSIPQLVAAVGQVIQNLLAALGRALVNFLRKGEEIFGSIEAGFKKKLGSALEWGKSVVQNIVSGIKGAISKVISIGRNIVEGIWNGISNGLGWIKGKITGWVGNVLSFIKNLFGIKSPSTLMRDQVGKFLAQGIGVGFVDEMGNVEKMMQDAMPDVSGFISPVDMSVTGTYRNSGEAEIISLLREILDNLDIDLVLQDGTIVGWLDKALGRRAMQKARGNA